MAKPNKNNPESFEKTEYSKRDVDVFSTIKQIVQDKERESPSCGILVSLKGQDLKLVYHTYEMMLPSNMPVVTARAKESLDEMVKHLKKEFKVRTKRVLDMKEKKDQADYNVTKVSMNERYYACFWRIYELELE